MNARAGLAALPLLALIGCGSAPLSAAELRQQATSICSRADRRIAVIPTPPNQSAGNAFLKQGIAALDPELGDLKALKAPSDEVVVYQAALKALSGELDALHSAVSKLDQGADPVKTFRALQDSLAPLETDADNAWRALGVSACLSR
jgi:ABC-type uncharacterized transport system YnjBCD substrate-binding protein